MGMVLAAADIGSNTVHLLVADVNGSVQRRLANESEWLSLGEVVSRERRIPDTDADRLVGVLARYKAICTTFKAQKLYVFATEAMRVAENHDAVLQRIKKEVGVTVDLIPSHREAELSWRGTQLDCSTPEPAALVEIGGGSVQVAVVQRGALTHQVSLPLGTGRLIEQTGLVYPCPPDRLDRLGRLIDAELMRVADFPRVNSMVVSGGVGRGIWRALHPDGLRDIVLPEVKYLEWAAARLTASQGAARFNVRLKRGQTLVPGAMVFRKIMERLDIDHFVVSEFGVREGAIMELAANAPKAKTAKRK
ncbi:MAG: hypothetical protein JNJ45_10955 [Chthonomonas sp.]|nr:hypothetical protein [Chthonomonas sp.]